MSNRSFPKRPKKRRALDEDPGVRENNLELFSFLASGSVSSRIQYRGAAGELDIELNVSKLTMTMTNLIHQRLQKDIAIWRLSAVSGDYGEYGFLVNMMWVVSRRKRGGRQLSWKPATSRHQPSQRARQKLQTGGWPFQSHHFVFNQTDCLELTS